MDMAKSLSLAVIQTPGEPGASHLDEVGRLIVQAAGRGARLVLLPELFAMPFRFDVAAWRWATPQGGAIEAFLRSAAKMAGVYLGGSYLEARGSDFFNTFALASPAGDIVGRVGKAHPCSLERCLFAPSPGPQVIETELGRVGVAICYDNNIRTVADRLLGENPDLWLMPMSAPLLPYSLAGRKGVARYLAELRDSPAGLARHLGIPVAMANKFGPWQASMPGWLPAVKSRFPGASRIVEGDGRELAVAADAVEVCVAEVTLAPERKRLFVPPEFDRNRPWVSPPLPDYRLFPLYEWWGARYYRRHPQRAALAQQRSRPHG